MLKLIAEIDTSKKSLRNFGIVMSLAMAILGSILFKKTGYVPRLALYWSVALLSLAFLLPSILKPFHIAWMLLGLLLGAVMSRVVLTLLYFGVILPLSLIARMVGKDFLSLKLDPDSKSYWIERNDDQLLPEKYKNQY